MTIFTTGHTREYARNHGAQREEEAWVLTPFDTWEANPHYSGPPVPHPEAPSRDGDTAGTDR